VPFPPGGGVDTIARVMSAKLAVALGQQIIIENRPGAGAVIGTRAAAKAPPDGYTLVMFTTSGNSVNCLRAAKAMKKAGGAVIGLLGKGGGKVKSLCDLALVVDSTQTNHIQEAHQVVMHLILEAIDAQYA